jgi:hypothetical protein
MLLTGTVYRFLLVERREDINRRLDAVSICDRIFHIHRPIAKVTVPLNESVLSA